MDIEIVITRQILIAAKFCLQSCDRCLILHKIGHFQPFPEFQLSKKFSWRPPFAKIPKLTNFSCLGNYLLRCVGNVVCNILALFLSCMIRAFIPPWFQ